MKMKIQEITIDGAGQKGVLIKCWITVPTRTEYIDKEIVLTNVDLGVKRSYSTVISLIRFFLKLRKYVKDLQSEPGNYDLSPTCYNGLSL